VFFINKKNIVLIKNNMYKYLSLTGTISLLKQYQNKVREGYDDYNEENSPGIALAIIIPLIILYSTLWVWALVILIKYWKQLPLAAKVFGILGVFPGTPIGPVITIVFVYALKDPSLNN